MSDPIYDLAVPAEGNLVIGVAFENETTTWSLPQGERLASFLSSYNYGGNRLAVIGGEDPLALTGGYGDGCGAYKAATGERIWFRRGLRQIQDVAASEFQGLVAVGLARGPMRLLDLRTGEDRGTVRGARHARFNSAGMVTWSERGFAYVRPQEEECWRVATPLFGDRVSTVAFADGVLLVVRLDWSVAAHSLAEGTEIWRLSPWIGKNAFIREATPLPEGGWRLIVVHLGSRGWVELVTLDAKGQLIETSAPLHTSRGTRLNTSAVSLTGGGRAVWIEEGTVRIWPQELKSLH